MTQAHAHIQFKKTAMVETKSLGPLGEGSHCAVLGFDSSSACGRLCTGRYARAARSTISLEAERNNHGCLSHESHGDVVRALRYDLDFNPIALRRQLLS
eukprot:COSAG02_NODE_1974_length_10214_cov_6.852694_11_plen_98_part_01